MENVNVLKFRYLMAEFKSTRDPKFAMDICDMFATGNLKATGSTRDGKILFIVASKYRSKCSRCHNHYEHGDPVFVKNQKAWHTKCATVAELDHPYYKECLEKGLIDDAEDKSEDDTD
jgi:hypothetical protein